jgi:hypothetical protein
MAGNETKQPARRRGGGRRGSQHAVNQRVRAIAGWMIVGKRTSEIYRLVVEHAEKERRDRATARETRARLEREHADASAAVAEGETPPPAPALPALPPVVWGDGKPPSERMIDYYIRKARQEFEKDGTTLSKSATAILGQTWARMNQLYARALHDKKYHVCVRVLELTTEIFGLKGAIKIQFLTEPQPDADETPTPESNMTEQQLVDEWRRLARVALMRAKGGTIVDVTPPHVPPPKMLGDGNGTNGVNGKPHN